MDYWVSPKHGWVANAAPLCSRKGFRLDELTRLNRLSLPDIVVGGVVLFGIIWGLIIGQNPSVTIAAGLVTMLAVKLLLRPDEPPTLLLLAAIHLVQVSTALVYANLTGVDINTLSEHGVNLENATFVALGGVLCLILGMFLGNAGPAVWPPAVAQAEARTCSPVSAFRFWLVALGMSLLFGTLSTLSEGVRQLFLAGAGIQWIGLFLLAYVYLAQRSGLGYFLIAVGIEIGIGFTGFFAEFREVFYVLFVAFAAAMPKLNFRSVFAIAATVILALLVSVFWTAIKKDYRGFLNQGSHAQEVIVPFSDRLTFLADRVSEANVDTMAQGLDLLVKRLSYVEFFGATLNFVPASRPHESGAITRAAIEHILFPRLLFPDKAPLPSDTEVTVAYTGLDLALSPNVSISIGYPGELYIDFGVPGMMACMGIFGFFYGKASRYIQQHCDSALVAYGATLPLLIPGIYFETALAKTLGGVCTAFVILLLMSKFVFPFTLKALAWESEETKRYRDDGSMRPHLVDDPKGPL
jgi:hypothetical protein